MVWTAAGRFDEIYPFYCLRAYGVAAFRYWIPWCLSRVLLYHVWSCRECQYGRCIPRHPRQTLHLCLPFPWMLVTCSSSNHGRKMACLCSIAHGARPTEALRIQSRQEHDDATPLIRRGYPRGHEFEPGRRSGFFPPKISFACFSETSTAASDSLQNTAARAHLTE